MKFNQKMMMSFAVIVSVMIMGTTDKKKCCTSVSTSGKKITSLITGFRHQEQNYPCVRAVIFYTAKGELCRYWRQRWVRQKVRELRKLQRQGREMKINSTGSPPLMKPSCNVQSLSVNIPPLKVCL